jgi:hypothetical protein
MSTKSNVGPVVAAVAVSLLLDALALRNGWPTPGGYLVDLMLPSKPVEIDWRIVWAVDAAAYVATNLFCCLAILYAICRAITKIRQAPRDSAT